ncbi:MAG: c-type cytochrome [Gemmatimonadaceae bacterium]|nr:c-type cytochrome [Gemmatimonadaceae bacterium]
MRLLIATATAAAIAAAAGSAAGFAAGPAAIAPADTTFPPAVVALGDSIFHGIAAGGLCFTCHGPRAKGIPSLGPDLTDAQWLNGDGSYEFLVKTITTGVPKPKQAATPMLPMGGVNLSAAQVRAVAAYVYTLRPKR